MKRKILTFVLAIALFIPILSVKAETITTEDIANKMKETLGGLSETKEIAMGITQIISNEQPEIAPELEGIEALFDESNFEITSTPEEIIVKNNELNLQTTITYNNSILEFNYPGDRTNLNYKEYLFTDLVTRILLASSYMTKGYDKNIVENYMNSIDSATLTETGFEVTGLVFNQGTENEVASIDTLKIDINKISIPESEKTPVLTISDITSNSLKITTTWENATEENPMCMIYRAKENENFEYIMSINCYGTMTISDQLEPNTKYKYKAGAAGYSNFGETVEATTLKEEKQTNTTETKKNTSTTTENPKTGVVSYGTAGLLALVTLSGTYVLYKNKISKI